MSASADRGTSAYLDHAATTPLRPEAREAMLPFLGDRVGNPSGAHAAARAARQAIDEARDTMAELLGCEPSEVVFTSGGTESDNAAVVGVRERAGGTVVCSAVEHHAVLDSVGRAGGRTVAVHPTGVIDVDALADALAPGDVSLVSVMAVNNEVGTIQPIAEVAEVVRAHAPEARLHTDAVQAFAWLDPVDALTEADLVSISAHKFGGPQGVGALVVRKGTPLAPLLVGGGQERELRSGTHNVAGIVGMAAAARACAADRKVTADRVEALRDRLVDTLRTTVVGVAETITDVAGGDRSTIVPSIAHLCIDGVESESLLFLLDRDGVYASAASACASGAMDPSHVLAAMGVPRSVAGGSLRLSLGWTTTDADVDHALEVVPAAVERLRAFA
jgi:cysteine desulfurase